MLDINTNFDSNFYLSTNPDVAEGLNTGVVSSALEHFQNFGKFEGRAPSLFFDPEFYLSFYNDVAEAVSSGQTTAIDHFLTQGQFEDRDPIAQFNTDYYLAYNPDILEAVESSRQTPDPLTAYQHFLQFGQFENREFSDPLNPIRRPEFEDVFTPRDYLTNNPDVAEAVARGETTAIAHYLEFGEAEERPGTSVRFGIIADGKPISGNNTTFQISQLAENGSLKGFSAASDLFVGTGASEQIYNFALATANRIKITLDNLTADADLSLYNDRNNNGIFELTELVALSQNAGTQADVIEIHSLYPSDRYYAIVSQFEGDTEYELTLEVTPIQFPLETAVDVGLLGQTPTRFDGNLSGDDPVKTYRFSLDAPSNIDINLSNIDSSRVQIELLQDINNNGQVDEGEVWRIFPGLVERLAIEDGNAVEPRLSFLGLPAGEYFIGVSQMDLQAETTPYSLNLSAISAQPSFQSLYGYGRIDAAAAVARAIGEQPFAPSEYSPSVDINNAGDLNLIQVPAVWNRGFTGKGVIIAVIDDGVDGEHPGLKDNMWVNVGEIPGNGIDDDNNGFVDDVRGWDFVDNDNNPQPPPKEVHGTHVAGTVAARNDNADWVLSNGQTVNSVGVAHEATIMPIRATGVEKIEDFAQPIANAIRYAVDNGARILQMSLGFDPDWRIPNIELVENALRYAKERGVVAVIASGNERANKGVTEPIFPAILSTQGLAIAVGAISRDNEYTTFSNPAGTQPRSYVTAPGYEVLSVLPGGSYNKLSGTSMATPHVSGVIALMLQANPNLTPDRVAQILIETANPNGIGLQVQSNQ